MRQLFLILSLSFLIVGCNGAGDNSKGKKTEDAETTDTLTSLKKVIDNYKPSVLPETLTNLPEKLDEKGVEERLKVMKKIANENSRVVKDGLDLMNFYFDELHSIYEEIKDKASIPAEQKKKLNEMVGYIQKVHDLEDSVGATIDEIKKVMKELINRGNIDPTKINRFSMFSIKSWLAGIDDKSHQCYYITEEFY